jgi:hypothetical protein
MSRICRILFGVQAHVRFSDKNASTELIDHAIPVIPKTVEDFSFSGKPLAAKDPVTIFGGPRVTAEMEPADKPRR